MAKKLYPDAAAALDGLLRDGLLRDGLLRHGPLEEKLLDLCKGKGSL